MANQDLSPGLTIPAQTQPTPTSIDFRPGKVEKWIATLPLANIGETARLVFNGLKESNQIILPWQHRYQSLELLHTPVNYIAQALKKHYIGQSFPLSDKNQKVVALAKALPLEMAVAYKVIIESAVGPGGPRIDATTLASAINQALNHLGQVMLICYQTYSSPPDRLWREMHYLYKLAEDRQLHEVKCDVTESVDKTVAGVYRQILLMALANPYRLRQSTVQDIHDSLYFWSRYCRLFRIDAVPPVPGMLALNLDSDAPPKFYALLKDSNPEHCRALVTTELIQTLRDQIAQLTNNEESAALVSSAPSLPVPVLRQLLIAWGGMAKRTFSRTQKNASVVVALGLSATHHCLSQPRGPRSGKRGGKTGKAGKSAAAGQALFQNRAKFSGQDVAAVGRNDAPDIWDLYKHNFSLSGIKPSFAKAEQGSEPERFALHSCAVINESAGGMCLAWKKDGQHAPKTQIGELAGVLSDASPDSLLGIAVIRWMESKGVDSMEFGIQMLAPTAIPVATAVQTKTGEPREWMRSLLLPELVAIHQPATLLTPCIYHSNDVLLLLHEGQEQSVKLAKPLESTGAYTQFVFKTLDQPAPAPGGPDSTSGTDDFDNIWSML